MFLTEKPTPPEDPSEAPKPDRVLVWRQEVLERAGYDENAAKLIARRRNLDLHLAVDLLKQGCDVDTALRILL